MKTIIQFLILCPFVFWMACEDTTTTGTGGNDPTSTTDSTEIAETPETTPAVTEVEKHNCEIKGKVLEDNQFWAKDANTLVCIVADEETKDDKLGDSHRILEVYNTQTCERIERHVLPVNVSPDYPYKLAEITYSNGTEILAIKGFKDIYCYDVKQHKLIDPVQPKFMSQRYAEDSQSGMIKRLEVWEDYLIGYAQDMGVFVFDLSAEQPKSVLPFAEYEVLEGEEYNSLFLLKSKSGADTYQAILPSYDFDKNEFIINPLLSQPERMITKINASARNNRFIVLRQILTETTSRPLAIDMETRERVILPEAIQSEKTKGVLDWLKKQNN